MCNSKLKLWKLSTWRDISQTMGGDSIVISKAQKLILNYRNWMQSRMLWHKLFERLNNLHVCRLTQDCIIAWSLVSYDVDSFISLTILKQKMSNIFLFNLFTDSWTLQFERGGALVSLRSLLWQGYVFYHVPGSRNFGSIYVGTGEKNLDLPFMLWRYHQIDDIIVHSGL